MIRIRFTGEGAVIARSQPDRSGPPKSDSIIAHAAPLVKTDKGKSRRTKGERGGAEKRSEDGTVLGALVLCGLFDRNHCRTVKLILARRWQLT